MNFTPSHFREYFGEKNDIHTIFSILHKADSVLYNILHFLVWLMTIFFRFLQYKNKLLDKKNELNTKKNSNILGKGMNPSLLPLAMGK